IIDLRYITTVVKNAKKSLPNHSVDKHNGNIAKILDVHNSRENSWKFICFAIAICLRIKTNKDNNDTVKFVAAMSTKSEKFINLLLIFILSANGYTRISIWYTWKLLEWWK
ncbi:hypothetical protein EBY67_07695, partial [bacterium]|nr:hypothetical protein [bacterium]